VPGSLAAIDTLAAETRIKVALVTRNPKADIAAVTSASKQIGLATDSASLTVETLPAVKDRLFTVEIRRAGGLTPLFNEMNRLEIRPLFLTLATATAAEVDTFEKSIQPTLAAFVDKVSKTMAIRNGNNLPADVKARIDAAIPRTAYAKPKKPRKLLVIDACVANMSHNTIPHFNLAIELMARHTGAFEAVFDNNLDNLKWPKIKDWDAIYLNDTVGELFPDPAVRESLLRYVKEGGGLGGWHGSPWVSRSWRELGDLVGAMDAPHRIEQAYIKLDDPKSPINQAFDGTGIEHIEEFYRFHHEGPTAHYSRDNLHVLLSLDLAKSPAYHKPDRSGQPFYTRPDGDIAVAWIRNYGKGRVYYNSMGHMPETMMSKAIMGHVFAAIQYLVGDLGADATPSAKLR
jgi:type 1 glutamine amidotransferase